MIAAGMFFCGCKQHSAILLSGCLHAHLGFSLGAELVNYRTFCYMTLTHSTASRFWERPDHVPDCACRYSLQLDMHGKNPRNITTIDHMKPWSTAELCDVNATLLRSLGSEHEKANSSCAVFRKCGSEPYSNCSNFANTRRTFISCTIHGVPG